MCRVFANGLRDWGSIPDQIIPKSQKMLLNTQHDKVRIKGKVEQSRELWSIIPCCSNVVAIKKGTFRSPLTKVINFIYILLYIYIYTHIYKKLIFF